MNTTPTQPTETPIPDTRPRPTATRDAAHTLARHAAQLALSKKASDVLILHVGEISTMTDFFVIATAGSEPQVRAIAHEIEDKIREEYGDKPWHVEGLAAGTWVLMDYVDFVVHIFQPEARDFYMLERLWGDARREVAVDVPRPAAAAVAPVPPVPPTRPAVAAE